MARHRALLIPSAADIPGVSVGEWPAFHADTEPATGDFLMERDNARLAALEADPGLGASLVLYRWAEPTISLGYAQREARVLDAEAIREAGIPVVRRPTGGRAILHVDEWTWSAVVPLDHERFGGGLRESLAGLSAVIRDALAAVGVALDPSGGTAPWVKDDGFAVEACFHRAGAHELTVGGRKLAGAAQRRLGRALLTQGTILAGPGHEALADFLAGDPVAKWQGRESLRRGTVTLDEAAGFRPSFRAFARALGSAWEQTIP
jgi:lipoate-protein ligase A